jgi:hypothetical protein
MRTDQAVLEILREAKKLAQRYRALTGKPLGITGEVAEYEAARILDVELTPARQAGYDALERVNGVVRRLQVKGRCLLPNCKPGQRLGSIDIQKDWDAVFNGPARRKLRCDRDLRGTPRGGNSGSLRARIAGAERTRRAERPLVQAHRKNAMAANAGWRSTL